MGVWFGILFLMMVFIHFLPSNNSDGESTFENQCSYLMDEEGIVGTALHELSHENHLQVKVCSYQC